jgi:hypothetical protein
MPDAPIDVPIDFSADVPANVTAGNGWSTVPDLPNEWSDSELLRIRDALQAMR